MPISFGSLTKGKGARRVQPHPDRTINTSPSPPLAVIVSCLGRSPGSRLGCVAILPDADASVGKRPTLAAYSCGGSAGISPASLLACDSHRRNQSIYILGWFAMTCQYRVFAFVEFYRFCRKSDLFRKEKVRPAMCNIGPSDVRTIVRLGRARPIETGPLTDDATRLWHCLWCRHSRIAQSLTVCLWTLSGIA
jgi:hypothetical protein